MINQSPLRSALDALKHKTVIVTGGGRGLGRAIASGFIAEGAHVAIVGRDAEKIRNAAGELTEGCASVRGFVADVSKEDDVARLVDEVQAHFGSIDVVVNNAGINPFYKRAEDTTLEEWRDVIDINLTGVFLMCRAAGRLMLSSGSGSIINITSVAAKVGLTRTTAYCAAKGGVELLTKQLAVEWATKGVRVNAVGPGYFETDLTAGLRENDGLRQGVTERTPMARFGKPDELVGACLYLASSAASFVTGHSLMVDGGWTAR